MLLSTVLVWAAPAQVILISALGAGATPLEAALAVGLSGVRLSADGGGAAAAAEARAARGCVDLILPAHFTAVSMWVESLRLAAGRAARAAHRLLQRARHRLMVGGGRAATSSAFIWRPVLPAADRAALLFLTPMSFLISTRATPRMLVDRLALALGLVVGPLLACAHVGLDLMWTGLVGGTPAYRSIACARRR